MDRKIYTTFLVLLTLTVRVYGIASDHISNAFALIKGQVVDVNNTPLLKA